MTNKVTISLMQKNEALSKELEAKNRELEIEASLEKVRAVAMGMKEPADMLYVCKTISLQLQSLGVKEIRNVQTAILYESKGTYMNYEYYAKHKKTFITETLYTNHKIAKAFAKKMLKGKDETYITHIKGIKVREWLAYQKSTNVFIDKYLNTASSLNYYWHSLGPVALGISTYVPLKKTELELFQRFLNVFELAYRRFIDIEKAIAQAKEAQIETSLERVRAQAMAMRTPEDLTGICEVLYAELHSLGFTEMRNAMINIHDDAKRSFVNYDYSDEIGKSLNQLTYEIHPLVEKQIKQIRSSEGFSETWFKGKDLEDWKAFRKEIGEKDDPRIDKADALYYYFYSIGTGSIGISTFSVVAGEKLDVLKRFRNVFTLAYQRYTDIAQAEAQAREAKIEAALERTRTQSMIMQHSNELDDTLRVFHQQILLLGINSAFSFLWLPDEKNDRHIFWAAWKENGNDATIFKSKAINYPLNRNEPATAQCLIDWKSNEPVYSYHVPPAAVENYFAAWKELLDGVEKLKPEYFSGGLHYVEAFMKYGCFGVMVTDDLTEDEKKLLSRFAIEFERTYTRFLDLQKAEAQAREAQIEAALERVRSRTMAMQKSEELKEVIKLVYQQLMHLKIKLDHAGFVVDYKPKGDWTFWIADEQDIPAKITHPYFESVWANQFNEAKEKGEDFFATHLNLEEKNKFYNELLSYVPGLPEASKDFYLSCPGLAASTVLLENVGLYIENFSGILYNDEENNTLMRFGKVFQQTYTRFLDLQKAEAQAREAQIELGLERVRARAMAMQKSDELSELVDTVFKELTKLDFALTWCIINIIDEPSLSNTVWAANPDITQAPESYHMKFEDYPFHDAMMKGWKERKTKYVYVLEGNEKKVYDEYLFNETEFRKVPEAAQAASRAMEKYVATFSFSNFGGLQTVGDVSLSDTNLDILSRFGKVFDLTYTRFNDLKQAEAQARESQIQLTLERVRARTMAMQKSDELPEAANLLFQQVQSLGMPAWSAGYCIWDDDKKAITLSMSSEGVLQPSLSMPLTEDPSLIHFLEAHQQGESFFVEELGGEALKSHYVYLRTLPGVKETLEDIEKAGFPVPTFQIFHCAYFTKGFLLFITYEPVPEAHEIFKRFAKVFEQTYTRFLDLQKAEAQARESQIQLALERVRARTMAMHKSDELAETSLELFQQFKGLGETSEQISIGIFKEEDNIMELYSTLYGSNWKEAAKVDLDEPVVMNKIYTAWKEQKKSLVIDIAGNELRKYNTYRKKLSSLEYREDRWVIHIAFFSKGVLTFSTNDPHPQETIQLLERFAGVFEQTYTRFLDLQKAEAQAREAQIEAALEKVRSRSLAMQKPKELTEVAELLRKEMGQLGVEELETSSIYIVDKENLQAECWYAIKDIREENKNLVSDEMTITFADTWVGNEMGKFYRAKKEHTSIVMKGDNRKEWINYCAEKSNVLQGYYGDEIPERTYHLVKFNGGYMGAASPGSISAVSWDLLRRAASVFSLAYTRFNDLQIAEAHALQAEQDLIAIKESKQKAEEALTELQATQKQLIQAEKMASLGELTAGIAHEIQNPLNFVNNFSEVSKELLDEMKEAIEKGDTDEAKEIMNDVIQNLEKINNHGKRADGIVKGMLQHSRSSSNQKEPTNINALADEYLRLAYHGLRAKDKTFNATLKTDFDETIGNISIIPQDIGRVILNLITNAFYVVNEKALSAVTTPTAAKYEPTVSVSTKKVGDKVEIKVADNGNGIPQKILDKIFQPFFTTKPTGQGTGLGLSLSYDIVKAHGGELKVETKEGGGSEFIIQLPNV